MFGPFSGSRHRSCRQVVTEPMTPHSVTFPKGHFNMLCLTLWLQVRISSLDRWTPNFFYSFLFTCLVRVQINLLWNLFLLGPSLGFAWRLCHKLLWSRRWAVGCNALTLCPAESPPLTMVHFRTELGCVRMGIMHWEMCEHICWIKKKINFKSVSPLSC